MWWMDFALPNKDLSTGEWMMQGRLQCGKSNLVLMSARARHAPIPVKRVGPPAEKKPTTTDTVQYL
jgi:hypothetical protein